MSEWKQCPKCGCMNLNREACVDCGRDLKDVAADLPQPPPTAEAKPACARCNEMRSELERLRDIVSEVREEIWHTAWNAAIEAALLKTPGGNICDPQEVADEIRELMSPNEKGQP